MEFIKFLFSFESVETLISLVSFIVAAVLGFLALQNSNKMKRIATIIEKADTQTKADLANSLVGVMPSYKIPELTSIQGFKIVKMQLEQRAREFKLRIIVIIISICLLFTTIIILLGKSYVDYKTSGSQSPIIIGPNAKIEYIDSLSFENKCKK